MANHSQVQRTMKRNVTLQRKRRKLEGAALTERPLEKTKRSGWLLVSHWLGFAVSPWLGCDCFSLASLLLFSLAGLLLGEEKIIFLKIKLLPA